MIPQVPDGTVVHYYIEAESDSVLVQAPSTATATPSASPLVTSPKSTNDFETNDGDWTSELLAGENTEGANDWQWGRPLGEATRRLRASVWGNGLGADNYNGEKNDRHNASPPRDRRVWPGRIFLQYRRWLNVEDAY